MMVCYHTQACQRIECDNKNSCSHKSTVVQKNLNSIAHFGVLLDRDFKKFDEKATYGYDCAEQYLQHLLNIEHKVTKYIAQNIPCKPLTEHQKKLHPSQFRLFLTL